MVWLILPTYDEAGNVERVVEAALEVLRRAAPGGHRVLVVDDDSPDGTGRIADDLAARHPDEVQVLHRTAREGLGPAYLAGFEVALGAGAERVLQMDADLSHDPADLERLLATSAHADLVLGSRYVRGGSVGDWGPVRRAVSRGGCWYAEAVLGLPTRDLTGGFKCFRREVLESIDLAEARSHGYVFQIELTYRALQAGFRVVEIPIRFRDRDRGRSKMSPSIALEAIAMVPRLRWGRRGRAVGRHMRALSHMRRPAAVHGRDGR